MALIVHTASTQTKFLQPKKGTSLTGAAPTCYEGNITYTAQMIREDLSNNLVHLVKGDTAEAALATFDSILAEQSLRGGNGNIKGGWRCVCFTEQFRDRDDRYR